MVDNNCSKQVTGAEAPDSDCFGCACKNIAAQHVRGAAHLTANEWSLKNVFTHVTTKQVRGA